MIRRGGAVVLALILSTWASEARTQPANPPGRSPTAARTVIVVGGVLVSVGFVLSWTGIGGLVWEATQHQSVRWAAPVSIASVPVEIVGSILVLAGAVELLGSPPPAIPSTDPVPAPPAVAMRPAFSVPLVGGEF